MGFFLTFSKGNPTMVNTVENYKKALFNVFGVEPNLLSEPHKHHRHETFTMEIPETAFTFTFLINTESDELEDLKMYEGSWLSIRLGGLVPYEVQDELKFAINGMY